MWVTSRVALFSFVFKLSLCDPDRFRLENHSMHAIDWPFLGLAREKLFTPDSACNDIAYKWITLGQIGSKVHLLPVT